MRGQGMSSHCIISALKLLGGWGYRNEKTWGTF